MKWVIKARVNPNVARGCPARALGFANLAVSGNRMGGGARLTLDNDPDARLTKPHAKPPH
jgi:hypothetical protein